ncbi:MAG: hypothetical protein R3C53_25865 [Pirellulaceae bacterium]
MPIEPPFKPASEICIKAGRVAASSLPDEVAETLPIPRRTEDEFALIIMHYSESGPPGKREVGLPHHATLINPQTAEVEKFWKCSPEELGIQGQLPKIDGVGIDPEMTSMQFVEKRKRFLEISANVWEAYFRRNEKPNAATKVVIAEYVELFGNITKQEVAPFYIAASPDFFRWLQAEK